MGRSTPLILPGVNSAMLEPEFWLTCSTDRAIDADCFTLAGLPEVEDYLQVLNKKSAQRFYYPDSSPLEPQCWENVANFSRDYACDEDGLITERTCLKLLPQAEPFLNSFERNDLDRNQLSLLELGDRCRIFAREPEGKWLGVITRRGTGWVLASNLAIGTRTAVTDFQHWHVLRTVTQPEIDIVAAERKLAVSMGCGFPEADRRRETVWIPQRTVRGELQFGEGMVTGETVPGHVPATRFSILRQAFRYLGTKYSWGDYDPDGVGIDCSRFVQNVFQVMGVEIPRNSQEQLASGRRKIELGTEGVLERRARLKTAAVGDLLFTDSHVLIYLGEYQDNFYAIHAFYEFLEPTLDGEVPRTVKQVIVSDLRLGEGASGGSLLEKLTAIVDIY